MNKTNKNATTANVAKMTAWELFNDYLCDIDLKIDRADMVTMILQREYFGNSAEFVKSDIYAAYRWKESYTEIQTLLDVVRDAVFEAKKIMQTVMEFDSKNIKEWKEVK